MAHEYEDVAASQTDQVIGSGGEAAGQHISHVVIFPATTSPGAVTLTDGGSGKVIFPGGASSVSNLVPFTVYLGCDSRNGSWKITTGTNVSARAVGDFN
jgi:hypothetical protein